jgi:ubiquinone/menaquinone biosynthesis C-methylase UbiE
MYTSIEHLVIRRIPPVTPFEVYQPEYDQSRMVNLRTLSRFQVEIETACRLIKLRKGMRVLEVGAGFGFLLYELANLGVECVDVDICPGYPEFVNYAANFYGLPIYAIRGDSCDLPLEDESFDAVISIDTFEHIWDCDRALHEQARVLKKGGRLGILVGNIANPKMLYELLIKKYVRSKGREGGLRWLLTKGKELPNFGMGWHGKDEDMHTIWWWKRKLSSIKELSLVELSTTRAYSNPDRLMYRLMKPYVGSVVLSAIKK